MWTGLYLDDSEMGLLAVPCIDMLNCYIVCLILAGQSLPCMIPYIYLDRQELLIWVWHLKKDTEYSSYLFFADWGVWRVEKS